MKMGDKAGMQVLIGVLAVALLLLVLCVVWLLVVGRRNLARMSGRQPPRGPAPTAEFGVGRAHVHGPLLDRATVVEALSVGRRDAEALCAAMAEPPAVTDPKQMRVGFAPAPRDLAGETESDPGDDRPGEDDDVEPPSGRATGVATAQYRYRWPTETGGPTWGVPPSDRLQTWMQAGRR